VSHLCAVIVLRSVIVQHVEHHMSTDEQTFKLTAPDGKVIMTGNMSAIMEHLPDTPARDAALSSMLQTAADAVEAEEKQAEAIRSCAQMLSTFADAMNARMDQFEKQRALSAKRAEAQRKAQDQRRVQRYLDELPNPENPEELDLYSTDPAERAAAIRDEVVEGIPPAKDPTGAELEKNELETDDGDLEIKHAPDPDRYAANDLGLEATPTSTRQTFDLPKQKQVAQPIAASFW
jgi:hypothetical protein